MGPMSFASLTDGLVHKDQWDKSEKALREEVDTCVAGGCKRIITSAGQRKGMSYEEGMDLTVAFMNRVKSYLEDKGVIFVDYTDGALTTTGHIAQLGPARGAWFHDPDGNTLGLRQG